MPFVYQDMIYKNCIKGDRGKPWCATTYNYDQDKKWGFCKDCHGGIPTLGGNAKGECCAFPFIYKGMVFNECTTQNSVDKWCSTTPLYDVDKQWGVCI
ncbi:hypothetical protein QZH41_009420, partial [Actinostola sp. cb2023]